MPYYLLQTTYAPPTLASMLQNPQALPQMLRSMLDKLGGSLEGLWFAFGDYDAVAICQMPDNEMMASLAMAIVSSGSMRTVKTTPLLTWEEGMHAMGQATQVGYQPAHPPGEP